MYIYTLLLSVSSLVILVCLFHSISQREKPMAPVLVKLLFCILIVLISNMAFTHAATYSIAMLMYSIYVISTMCMIYFMVRFALQYCEFDVFTFKYQLLLSALVFLDCTQIFVNIFTLHCFDLTQVLIEDNRVYFARQFYTGYRIHLMLTYALVAIILFTYIYKTVRVTRFNVEKYVAMLGAFLFATICQSYYLLSGQLYDTALIGYAICGIVMYGLTLQYFPFLLIAKTQNIIVSNMSDAIIFFDSNGECIYANQNAYRIFSKKENYLEEIKEKFFKLLNTETNDYDIINVSRIYRAGFDEFHYDIEYHPVLDDNRVYAGAFAIIRDRTEEFLLQAEEKYLSTHDELTGLFSNTFLRRTIQEQLLNDLQGEYIVGVSDILEFKMINDIFGWEKGNDVLRKIANVFNKYFSGTNAIYGRIVADKFAFLFEKGTVNTHQFFNELNSFEIAKDNTSYPITVHIGLYNVVDKSAPVSGMFDRASMAIENIKSDRQVVFAYYEEKLREDVLLEQDIVATLDEALENDEIIPYIQAQINNDGTVLGGEALVRWVSPTKGFISPGQFIPTLEKNGMIVKLDTHIWEYACKLLNKWSQMGREDTYISINISPIDFYFIDIYKTITELTHKYNIKPNRLKLEITETVVMTNMSERMECIKMLREDGFILEMDDFGSGYSSLNMLKDMPIDVLKLDMVFLNDTDNLIKSISILNSIISMAHQIEMNVICEGVETNEQVKYLMDAGCNTFQGYYFAKPIHFQEFEDKYISGGLYTEEIN